MQQKKIIKYLNIFYFIYLGEADRSYDDTR